MQKRTLALVGMLLISTLLVACLGAYLKFEVLRPFGLFQEKNLIELPFAVMRDPAAQFALKNARQEETEPPAETPTEPVFVLDYERSAVTLNRPMKLRFPFQTIIPIVKAPPVVVTEEWFDDALFIGDSRVAGLRDYARLGKADYFCSVGLTVFDAVKIKLSDKNFSTTNLETLLRTKRYGKVYISLGLNDCGYPSDMLMKGFKTLINTVQENQPDAVVVLHGMIAVGRKKASSKWYFSMDNLNKINVAISELADGDKIRYIDANDHFADEEGYLPSWRSSDGCHFDVAGYREWAQWILDNASTLNISFG